MCYSFVFRLLKQNRFMIGRIEDWVSLRTQSDLKGTELETENSETTVALFLWDHRAIFSSAAKLSSLKRKSEKAGNGISITEV